jgi:uncharacterized membrane protein
MTPLRAFSFLGVSLTLLGLATLTLFGWLEFSHHHAAIYVFFVGLSLLLAGLQLAGVGALGEYVGRTYTEVKHRPLFIVEEAVNVPGLTNQRLHPEVDLVTR